MNYTCLDKQTFSENSYRITPIRLQDIYLIKEWRNAQIDVLRQNLPLTDEMQKNYFETIILPSFSEKHPQQILFSFLKQEQPIGYGGLVHIDWKEKQGELSFLVDPKRSLDKAVYESDFSTFLKLIKMVAFNHLYFKRLTGETYDIRPHHISILEKAGFIEKRRLKDWVKINDKYVDAIIHECHPNLNPMDREG